MSDCWEEISSKAKAPSALGIGRNAIILRTRNRMMHQKKIHFVCNFHIGQNLLHQLSWTEETKLKFQWGKNEALGLVRICQILTSGHTGWSPKIYMAGYGVISTHALPFHNEINEQEYTAEIEYALRNDERQDGLLLLELKLPPNFYKYKDLLLDQPVKVIPQITEDVVVPKKIPLPSKPIIELPPSIPRLQNNTKNDDDNKFMSKGGIVTIEQICKYIRVGMGDSASYIDNSTIELNGTRVATRIALSYANNDRKQKRLPEFSLDSLARAR